MKQKEYTLYGAILNTTLRKELRNDQSGKSPLGWYKDTKCRNCVSQIKEGQGLKRAHGQGDAFYQAVRMT
ncbi:MAG: hypothetical protein ACLR2O_09410 [Coprococcus sp.]